ncbi:MAG: segregation ATPase, FtsK/SpoIIIE family [Acidobacteria bacterium]|nr:segregation ATPase, FtsK/SpoIIIE family [Acidobacteriota bacterium]
MDPNDFPAVDSIDHWNQAIDAEDEEDYQTAIEEYDACLCSTPDAETALEAFYRLGIAIQKEYDLDDQNLDDEQVDWRCCLLACCESASEIYEAHQGLWSGDTLKSLEQAYFESQALLALEDRSDEPANQPGNRDGQHIRVAQKLDLLGCFSDDISFQFDKNGELIYSQADDPVASQKQDLSGAATQTWTRTPARWEEPNRQTAEELRGVNLSQPAQEPIHGLEDKKPMEEGLGAEMLSLTDRLTEFINEYETTTSKLTNELDGRVEAASQQFKQADAAYQSKKEGLGRLLKSANDEAKRLSDLGSRCRETARDYLRQQSVEPNFSSRQFRGTHQSNKEAVLEAQKYVTQASGYLGHLQKVEKPKNTGSLFAGLGIPGFIISLCAAAGSSTGNGGTSFILVNILFLGLATAIAVIRTTSASSEMKSQYESIDASIAEADACIEAAVKYANSEYARDINAAQEVLKSAESRSENDKKTAALQFDTEIRRFSRPFTQKVEGLKKRFSTFYVETGFVGGNWNDQAWSQWVPATSPAFSACLGTLKSPPIETLKSHFEKSLLDFSIPALVPFADGLEGKCLLQKATGPLKEVCIRAAQSLMLRLLANVPPGKVLFTLLDPVGLGQSAAPFMSLADHEEKLITNRAWTEPQHIEEQLGKLTEHMENVIQKYLRNDYATIEEYNQKAGEVAEPYRVLVVFDFPVNFSETAARRLVSIAKNGPRCGVYTIIVMDTDPSKKLPYGFNLGDLENAANVIYHNGTRFVWDSKSLVRYTLLPDSPPSDELFKHIVKEAGSRAPESMRVEVPFDTLLVKAGLDHSSVWQGSTRERIHVPLGPQGAKKVQYLTLGTGTEHHAVCIGMPGSGKTNLMHIIITTMGLMYSPAEMQLYLVDFKQGVGFKRYAEVGLPHARVIAIDSEREFGLSVLQKLDKELNERGEKFRAIGVDAISDYRQKRPNEDLPRILLLVDEFQEFFSYDDNIGTQAGLLLDRLVRQGRYAGIHVMLGSQSLANRSSLPTSTLGQIGIRIALKCGESDARLIMGDGNLQARLLSRPGEAIYNSANGLIEGNSFFQVALFSEEDRNKRLEEIRSFSEQAQLKAGRHFDLPVIFEGNAPARFEECKALKQVLDTTGLPAKIKAADAWLGEPIAIRPPTAARFRRQGGSNLLIVTRDEEEGVGIAFSSLLSLFSQYEPDAARFIIFNLTTADSEWNEVPQLLAKEFHHDIQIVNRKNLAAVMNDLVNEANRRTEDQSIGTPEIYFVILGLHRARDLRDDEDGLSRYSKDVKAVSLDPHALFLTLLREGPESGIHVIAWSDAYAGVARIDRRIMGEFSMRAAGPMSNEDSGRVIDDALASKLDKPHRAVFYDEERPGQLEKFRPYGIPESKWIESVAARLRARGRKATNA